MAKQMRVGVKAALIGGVFLIIASIITAIVTNSNKGSNKSSIQKIDKQKVDSGSINNYNAERDVHIENNTYNDFSTKDIVVNESKNGPSSLMYLLGAKDLSKHYTDSTGKITADKNITEFTFGNPDKNPVHAVNIVLRYDKPFDTAFFEKKFSVKNGVFDKNVIRDSHGVISPDNKVITFKASYIGANTIIKIIVEKRGNTKVHMSGIGKLF